MGSSELNLTYRQSTMKPYIPKMIREFLDEVSLISNSSERLSQLNDYVTGLQDEMKKIDAFKRELPLCMLLLTDAIGTVKEELLQLKKSSPLPILEEFIPLKKISDDLDEKVDAPKVETASSRDKMNWLSSVQLWNPDSQNPCPDAEFSNNKKPSKQDSKRKTEEENNRPMSVMDDLFQSRNNRAEGRPFVSFKGFSDFPVMKVRKEDRDKLPGEAGLSLRTPGTKNARDDMESCGLNSISSCSGSGSASAANGQSNSRNGVQQRKQRRCWSPELHRRFVNSLQQLGGPQAATPKQIRDLMQVDGLTNDEVKSHLQKYRLHARKAPTTTNTSSDQHVLGDQWMPNEHHHESSKQSNSQSGSPQGPLHLTGSSRGTSGNSMEDQDDEKSESHSWRSQIHLTGKDGV